MFPPTSTSRAGARAPAAWLAIGPVVSVSILAAAVASLGCSDESRRRASAGESLVATETVTFAVNANAKTNANANTEINPRLLRRFQALPTAFEDGTVRSPVTIDLGRRLFYEPRLSRDGSISCSSCHDLEAFGGDGRPVAKGIDGRLGVRNTPTVYNAAGAFVQFWDGRLPTVEEQAKAPILHPDEMGTPDAAHAIEALRVAPGYVAAFGEAFPDDAEPLRWENVGRALGAFERGLVTPGRWDRFLGGETGALSRAERGGLKTFLDVGCMVCHTGPLLGASVFERVGIVEPWPNQKDHGRSAITKQPSDDMVFRVPSLRNVEKTAPYFHDGSAATLDEAVKMMGKHQLGLDLSETEVRSITTWLKSLTGEIPKGYIAQPGAAAGGDGLPAAVAVGSTAAGAEVEECGQSALADCPLQGWMKANAAPALAAGDFVRLERTFRRIEDLAVPPYANWQTIARTGAAASSHKDIEGVRAACKQCHDENRSSFRRDRRRQSPL